MASGVRVPILRALLWFLRNLIARFSSYRGLVMGKFECGTYQQGILCLRFRLIVVLLKVLSVTPQEKHFTLAVMIRPSSDIV